MSEYEEAKASIFNKLVTLNINPEESRNRALAYFAVIVEAADKEIAEKDEKALLACIAVADMTPKSDYGDGIEDAMDACDVVKIAELVIADHKFIADCEAATKDAELARLREALELEKENSLMAQSYAHDNGLYSARTGVQEVFVSPDGETLHDLMEGEKPFCRIEYYEDSGDDSVGIPSVSFWTLAENQEGTELLDVIALKSQ